MPATYGEVSWRGMRACGCMVQSIEDVVEPRLRAAGLLGEGEHIYGIQGAYNGTVSASGGTHDEGGALDHGKGGDAETRIWRESGWADWQRGDPHDPHFDDHSHGVVIGCPHLSAAAADQVYDYKQGRNGLADGGPDQSPAVPYITWQDAYDKHVEDDVKHYFLSLSTTTDAPPGAAVKFDAEKVDEGGFHAPDMAAITAPWDAVVTATVEVEGGAEVTLRKYDRDNTPGGDLGRSSGGLLTAVTDLPYGYTLRVVVLSGTATSAILKADIRAR